MGPERGFEVRWKKPFLSPPREGGGNTNPPRYRFGHPQKETSSSPLPNKITGRMHEAGEGRGHLSKANWKLRSGACGIFVLALPSAGVFLTRTGIFESAWHLYLTKLLRYSPFFLRNISIFFGCFPSPKADAECIPSLFPSGIGPDSPRPPLLTGWMRGPTPCPTSPLPSTVPRPTNPGEP